MQVPALPRLKGLLVEVLQAEESLAGVGDEPEEDLRGIPGVAHVLAPVEPLLLVQPLVLVRIECLDPALQRRSVLLSDESEELIHHGEGLRVQLFETNHTAAVVVELAPEPADVP